MSFQKYSLGLALLCSTSISMPVLASYDDPKLHLNAWAEYESVSKRLRDSQEELESPTDSKDTMLQTLPQEEVRNLLCKLKTLPVEKVIGYSAALRELVSPHGIGSFDQVFKLYDVLEKSSEGTFSVAKIVTYVCKDKNSNLGIVIKLLNCMNMYPAARDRAYNYFSHKGRSLELSSLDEFIKCVRVIADYELNELELFSEWYVKTGNLDHIRSVRDLTDHLSFYKGRFVEKVEAYDLLQRLEGAHKITSLEMIDDFIRLYRNYGFEQIRIICDWLKKEGAWERITFNVFLSFCNQFKAYPLEQLDHLSLTLQCLGLSGRIGNNFEILNELLAKSHEQLETLKSFITGHGLLPKEGEYDSDGVERVAAACMFSNELFEFAGRVLAKFQFGKNDESYLSQVNELFTLLAYYDEKNLDIFLSVPHKRDLSAFHTISEVTADLDPTRMTEAEKRVRKNGFFMEDDHHPYASPAPQAVGLYKVGGLFDTLAEYSPDLLPQAFEWILESGVWEAAHCAPLGDISLLLSNYNGLRTNRNIPHDELLRQGKRVMDTIGNGVGVYSILAHLHKGTFRLKSQSEIDFIRSAQTGGADIIYDDNYGDLAWEVLGGLSAERRDAIYDWIVRHDLFKKFYNKDSFKKLLEKLRDMPEDLFKDYIRCADEKMLLEKCMSFELEVIRQIEIFQAYPDPSYRRGLLWMLSMPDLLFKTDSSIFQKEELPRYLKKISGSSEERLQKIKRFLHVYPPQTSETLVGKFKFMAGLEVYSDDDLKRAILFVMQSYTIMLNRDARTVLVRILRNREWFYSFYESCSKLKEPKMNPIINAMEESKDEELVPLRWIHSFGLVARCATGDELNELVGSFKYFCETVESRFGKGALENIRTLSSQLIERPGFWDKCGAVNNLKTILGEIWLEGKKSFHKRLYICEWMIHSGVLQSCQNLVQIIQIVKELNTYDDGKLHFVCSYLQTSGVIPRCDDRGTLIQYLTYLKNFPVDRLMPMEGWMRQTGAWDKCVNALEISHIQEALKECSHVNLQLLSAWLAATGFIKVCSNGMDLKELLKYALLPPIDFDILKAKSAAVIKNGFLEKCQNGSELKELLGLCLHIPSKDMQDAIAFIKSEGIWDKMTNSSQIASFLGMFSSIDHKDPIFTEIYQRWVARGVACRETIAYLLNVLNRIGAPGARMILDNSDQLPEDIGTNTFLILLHFACHAFYHYNPAVHDLIVRGIENPTTRELTLDRITLAMGNEHPLVQEYILQAIGYDDHINKNGLLAINKEMMDKREGEVRHNPVHNHGLELNLERIRAPKVVRPIHMPVNVWYRLFEELEAYIKAYPNDVELCLEGSGLTWLRLKKLKDHHQLLSLLDPLNSLKTTKNITGYSMMLREVLKNIQETKNPIAFLQLLMNITSCKIGILNGIRKSHVLMPRHQELDEAELGTTDFVKQLTDFVSEEFRRYREETVLNNVVRDITRGTDTHNLHYLRVVIGAEIGLMYQNEAPEIDLNPWNISGDLRIRPKQELLSYFYVFYQPDDLIKRFQDMLNDGTIAATDIQGSTNFSFFVIDRFLEDEFDLDEETGAPVYNPKIVNINDEGKPTTFTKKAAELLLLKLGFLKKVE